MANLFNYDGKLMRALQKIAESLLLSLLWLLFSIPVFTIGAASAALYYTTKKSLINNQGYVWSEFWEAFKSNFKQATPIWLLFLAYYVLSGINFYLFSNYSDGGLNSAIVMLIIMLFFVSTLAFYYFPYIACFESTIKNALKNILYISYSNFQWSILLFILLAVSVIIFLLFPPIICVVPTLYALIANLIIGHIFKKYLTPEQLAEENEINGMDNTI